jgi:hypothetical protein
MFMAMILVCTTQELSSCEVFYNNETVFVTESACQFDLEDAVVELLQYPITHIETSCVQLPGSSA